MLDASGKNSPDDLGPRQGRGAVTQSGRPSGTRPGPSARGRPLLLPLPDRPEMPPRSARTGSGPTTARLGNARRPLKTGGGVPDGRPTTTRCSRAPRPHGTSRRLDAGAPGAACSRPLVRHPDLRKRDRRPGSTRVQVLSPRRRRRRPGAASWPCENQANRPHHREDGPTTPPNAPRPPKRAQRPRPCRPRAAGLLVVLPRRRWARLHGVQQPTGTSRHVSRGRCSRPGGPSGPG
jgi:hypothetical protein